MYVYIIMYYEELTSYQTAKFSPVKPSESYFFSIHIFQDIIQNLEMIRRNCIGLCLNSNNVTLREWKS